jgi:hypothetical protein
MVDQLTKYRARLLAEQPELVPDRTERIMIRAFATFALAPLTLFYIWFFLATTLLAVVGWEQKSQFWGPPRHESQSYASHIRNRYLNERIWQPALQTWVSYVTIRGTERVKSPPLDWLFAILFHSYYIFGVAFLTTFILRHL